MSKTLFSIQLKACALFSTQLKVCVCQIYVVSTHTHFKPCKFDLVFNEQKEWGHNFHSINRPADLTLKTCDYDLVLQWTQGVRLTQPRSPSCQISVSMLMSPRKSQEAVFYSFHNCAHQLDILSPMSKWSPSHELKEFVLTHPLSVQPLLPISSRSLSYLITHTNWISGYFKPYEQMIVSKGAAGVCLAHPLVVKSVHLVDLGQDHLNGLVKQGRHPQGKVGAVHSWHAVAWKRKHHMRHKHTTWCFFQTE